MTTEEKFWANIDKSGPAPSHRPELGPCWIWTAGKSDTGYGEIHQGKGLPKISTHRLSWKIHFGEIPEGKRVLHKCDVRACIRPDHLWVDTQRANILDALEKGRLEPQRQTFKRLWREKWAGVRCGENIHCSKLTKEKVIKIRKMYDGKNSTTIHLAAMFGVSIASIYDVVKRRTWKHIR